MSIQEFFHYVISSRQNIEDTKEVVKRRTKERRVTLVSAYDKWNLSEVIFDTDIP